MARKKEAQPGNETPPTGRLPLNALRVFDAVAARSSFSEAAVALHVTTAAVSMQIKALEDYLQVQLFRRNARDVQLTSEGQLLLPFVHRGLQELEQGFSTVRSGRAAGKLSLSMLASFLQKWLLPRLPAFRNAHPQIDLRIWSTANLVDFARDDVQAAIRLGRGSWPNLHAEKLLEERLVPVCSRETLERYGPLAGPGSTGAFPLVHGFSEPWSNWLSNGPTGEIWPNAGTAYDDSVAVLQAAEDHQGLALARWSLVAGDLASGRLVLACEQSVALGLDYYFVCPEAYLNLPKVRSFREWLFAEAAAAPRAPGQTFIPSPANLD